MMKRACAYGRVIATLCAVVLSTMILCTPYGHAASTIDMVVNDWHPAEIRGTIMSVDQESGSMVVNEVRVLLADTATKSGKKCVTRIMKENGNEVARSDLKQGRIVYIKAGTALDSDKRVEYVVAKDIYILSRAMSKREMQNRGIPMGSVAPW